MGSIPIFSGSSRFANDFSQTIERSVAIASLPLTQLGNQRTKLSAETSALGSISGQIASFRSAVKAVNDAKSALAVSVSNGSVAGASAASNALPGTYTIDVVSVGSRTNTASSDTLPKVVNPGSSSISTAASFTLSEDGASYTIEPSANTLDALAAAINGQTGAGVQAVIVNLGSAASPDYRLSLQSTKLGDAPVQLTEIDDTPQDLLTEISKGTLASYRVNGQPAGAPLTSASATAVPVAPGLTIDLLSAGQANVVVKKDINKLTGALSSLVAAYNLTMSEVDKHRGEAGGALAGQSIISGLARSLRDIVSYQGSGAVTDSTALGLSFSDKGVLSFDTAQFNKAEAAGALNFLGDINGGGLLGNAEQILDGIDDASTGIIPVASQSVRDQIASTDSLISDNQYRVDLLRRRLADQMAAADAMIGALEQQISYMNGLFESMKANAKSF
jgi:flagellar hook-associated protein 2